MHTRDRLSRIAAITLLSAGILPIPSRAQSIPAFSGADGAAGFLTGGRGGIVYHVTSLAGDTSAAATAFGSLKYGLNDANFLVGGVAQPRTIVFDVGGTIWLGGWDTQSRLSISSHNVTIAGQTAPGGINIMGGLVKYSPATNATYPNGGNVILRNVTIAPGYGARSFNADPNLVPRDFPDSYVYDAIDIAGSNFMVDHVSTAYATDETISANEISNNITIQYSNISQGQNYPQGDAEATGTVYTGHALGSLLQAGSDMKISVHHNLYAHQKGRLPRVGSEVGTGAHNDFRNNVFYNWLSTAGGGASAQPSFNKFVGNYYLAGPGGEDPVGGASTDITTRAGGTGIFNGSNATGTRVYHSGNFKDINKNGSEEFSTALTNADFGSSTFVTEGSFSTPYYGVTDSASAAYNRVLDYMGANWWTRDGVINTLDERIINEVRTGTGMIKAWADDPYNSDPNEGVEWRTMRNAPTVARALDWDTEPSIGYGAGDGMPTWWELAHGLNPNAHDHNGDFDNDGYTNIEEYINEVAAWPAPQAINWTGGNSRYALINNWDIKWQPSRFDMVLITTGTATVDAVGQHANIIRVGGGGAPAVLAITAGWLEVAQELEVKSNGTVNWSGGLLSRTNLKLNTSGRMTLTPGGDKTLQASALSVDSTSTLDLADNDLVVNDPVSFTSVRALVLAGRIIFTTGGSQTLAIFDNALVGATHFNGTPIDPDAVVGKYTYFGDINIDGQVTGDDYTLIDANLNTDPVSGLEWLRGDANLDGIVTGDDYTIIDANLGLGVGSPLAASRASVPEPSLPLLILLSSLLHRRARRHT
jgi:hypothetical protein